MTKLSVILTLKENDKYITETLESLVEQTTEDFDVVIIDDGAPEEVAEVCLKYCDEYVGFYYHKAERRGLYAARNEGARKANGEYFIFLECGDIITANSIEAVTETVKNAESKPDIITGRTWRYGDIEYEYEACLDVLALIPDIDKYESSLLHTNTIGCRAFRHTLFSIRSLAFDEELTAFAELLLIVRAALDGAVMTGCPDFIFERRVCPITDGPRPEELPTADNIRSLETVTDRLYEDARARLFADSGSGEDDDAYIQELIFSVFDQLINTYYRRLWFAEDEALEGLKAFLDRYAEKMGKTKFEKLSAKHSDLGLPIIFTKKADAAEHPALSVMLSFRKVKDPEEMVRSIYAQQHPFFELLIAESSLELFPEEYRGLPNVRTFSDRSFHFDARRAAKAGRVIDISSGSPLDIRVFRETVLARVPSMLTQYTFTQKRKTLSAKKIMKDKGFVFPSQIGQEEKEKKGF